MACPDRQLIRKTGRQKYRQRTGWKDNKDRNKRKSGKRGQESIFTIVISLSSSLHLLIVLEKAWSCHCLRNLQSATVSTTIDLLKPYHLKGDSQPTIHFSSLFHSQLLSASLAFSTPPLGGETVILYPQLDPPADASSVTEQPLSKIYSHNSRASLLGGSSFDPSPDCDASPSLL